MMRVLARARDLMLASALLLLASSAVIASQQPAALPPLSYVCPMPQDADVVEDRPGTCPKCGMKLQPARLESVWTCPVHAAVVKEKAGACPIDGRSLVPVTMTVTWTCAGSANGALEPGTCGDGTPRKKTFAPRPHGNHNPQHGGGFFMAPDNWHHLEGTYPHAGLFRLYVYDDYTKPLAATKLQNASGRITTADGRDILLVRKGNVLEANVGTLALPASLHTRVRFDAGTPEYVFDFTFETLTKDAAAPAVVSTNVSRTAQPTLPSSSSTSGEPTATGIRLGLADTDLPATEAGILTALQERNDKIHSLIAQGQLGSVYLPAFEAKDLALAIQARQTGLHGDRGGLIESAVGRIVRTAYLMDAFGDLGNKADLSAAYAEFSKAVTDIESAFGAPR